MWIVITVVLIHHDSFFNGILGIVTMVIMMIRFVMIIMIAPSMMISFAAVVVIVVVIEFLAIPFFGCAIIFYAIFFSPFCVHVFNVVVIMLVSNFIFLVLF